ncbi:MAG: VOC family protein [Betaproteobacteria bacterium]
MHHQGQLLDHVHLRVADVAASRRFYRAVLSAIGRLDAFGDGDGCFWADELYVDRADTRVSCVHLAFQARSEVEVRAFHAHALSAGGRDNGGPGLRDYGPGYYAAFVLDPDGNNIEAVWHGALRRSAESVVVE